VLKQENIMEPIPIVVDEAIVSKIYLIRETKVMLDKDLAELYGVSTKALKQQVKRNMERFPIDFMFELSKEEFDNLRSQIVTSSWGGTRYQPMAFTEPGVAMLSSVLNSRLAILVNIKIVRVFTKIRELLSTHKEIMQKLEQLERNEEDHDKKIMLIFDYLKQLELANQQDNDWKNRERIGFKSSGEKR
jgi:hypothetical protein